MFRQLLTLFQVGMGKFCPQQHRSLVTFRSTLQMSSYFTTLFLWTFYRSHLGWFSKRNWKFWNIWKKNQTCTKAPPLPPWKKKTKKIKNDFFLNHTFSTWIWILHVLSFFWCTQHTFFSKFSNFRFFYSKIFVHDQLHYSSCKKNHQKRFILASMDCQSP